MKTALNVSLIVLCLFASIFASGIAPGLIPANVPTANKNGNSNVFLLAGTIGAAGSTLCPDASGNATTSGCSGGTVTSVDGSVALGVESVVAGSVAAITGAGSVRSAHLVNSQTGATYTVLTGDRAKLVTHSNAGGVAVTLPQAGSSFPAGWFYITQNRAATGNVVVTPTTSTVDGASSITITPGLGTIIFSDGTNYFTHRGGGGVQAWGLQQTFSANDPIVLRNMTISGVNGHFLRLTGNSETAMSWADNTACNIGSNISSVGVNTSTTCPSAMIQAETATVPNSFNTAALGFRFIGQPQSQARSNSSVTGSNGSAIVVTAGNGVGFSGGTNSVGGNGGDVTLTGGGGGNSNSAGGTDGNGGNVAFVAGAAGTGAGTDGARGQILMNSHVAGTGGTLPTLDTGTLATGSSDLAGKVTANVTGVYTGVITFGTAWVRAPACTAQNETTANILRSTSTLTTLTITGTTVNNDVLSYVCHGY